MTNQLTLAYLVSHLTSDEQKTIDRALQQHINTLLPIPNPSAHPDLSSRRRLRHSPSKSQSHSSPTHPSTSLSAYHPPPRGTLPYCPSRTPSPIPRRYHTPTSSIPCACPQHHTSSNPPDPTEWHCTPAEEEVWDYDDPNGNGGHAIRKSRVRFADPIVTEVREFEKWNMDAYGRWRKTSDSSTEEDDEVEVKLLEEVERELAEATSASLMADREGGKGLKRSKTTFSKGKRSERSEGWGKAVSLGLKPWSGEGAGGGRLPVKPDRGERGSSPAAGEERGGDAEEGRRPKIKILRKVEVGRVR